MIAADPGTHATWDLSGILAPFDAARASRCALIVLSSVSGSDKDGRGAPAGVLAHLWSRCRALRVAADGAANSLPRGGAVSSDVELRPDVICGDFDSLTRESAAHWSSRGVRLVHAPSQYAGDMTKCLDEVAAAQGQDRWEVFVWGAFGGRWDLEMANFSSAVAASSRFGALSLLGTDCAAGLLPAGASSVNAVSPGEGPLCGLVPLFGPASAVTTTGLHWNLAGQEMSFGALVSTSNWLAAVYPYVHVCGPAGVDAAPKPSLPTPPVVNERTVTVTSSHPLVWTVSLHWQRALDALLVANGTLASNLAAATDSQA